MLKIKDNINLKELEKFGFREVKIKQRASNIFQTKGYVYPNEQEQNDFIYITMQKMLLVVLNNDTNAINILYDLIQAGLVEKYK